MSRAPAAEPGWLAPPNAPSPTPAPGPEPRAQQAKVLPKISVGLHPAPAAAGRVRPRHRLLHIGHRGWDHIAPKPSPSSEAIAEESLSNAKGLTETGPRHKDFQPKSYQHYLYERPHHVWAEREPAIRLFHTMFYKTGSKYLKLCFLRFGRS